MTAGAMTLPDGIALFFSCFETKDIRMVDLQLDCVFDHPEPFRLWNEVDQALWQMWSCQYLCRRRSGSSADSATAMASWPARAGGSMPASTNCCIVNQCGRNLRIVRVTPCREQGGKRGCYSRAVRQPRIEQRLRLADIFTERASDSLHGIRQVFRIEYGGHRRKPAVPLNKDRRISIHHHFGNTGIGDQMSDRL